MQFTESGTTEFGNPELRNHGITVFGTAELRNCDIGINCGTQIPGTLLCEIALAKLQNF